MKTFFVLAVSIISLSILLCPLAMAAPPMPNDVQMVKPNPSLPKEIADFWGKWEGGDSFMSLFIIVEKIDEAKASIYIWRSGFGAQAPAGWERIEAKVNKESGKYRLSFRNPLGSISVFYLKGKKLVGDTPGGEEDARLSRVP
jgi:hypothetical protein